MARQPVSFCNGCGKLSDERQAGIGRPPWVEARSFLATHSVTWEDLELLHTFCPECQAVVEATANDGQPVTDPEPTAKRS